MRKLNEWTMPVLALAALLLAGCASLKPTSAPEPPPAAKLPEPKAIRASAWKLSPQGMLLRADGSPYLRLTVEELSGSFDCFMKGEGFIEEGSDDFEYQILDRDGDLFVRNGKKVEKLPLVLDSTVPITFRGKKYPGCFLVSGDLGGAVFLSALIGVEDYLMASLADKGIEALSAPQADAVAVLERSYLVSRIAARTASFPGDESYEVAAKTMSFPATAQTAFAQAVARTKGMVLTGADGAPSAPPKSLAPDKASALRALPTPATLAALKKDSLSSWREILKAAYPEFRQEALY